MAFDDIKFHSPALSGDLGYSVYVAQHALRSLAAAVEKIAVAQGADVADEMAAVREDISILRREFDKLTGWQANGA